MRGGGPGREGGGGHPGRAIRRQGQLTPGIELLPKSYTPGILTAKIRQILDRAL